MTSRCVSIDACCEDRRRDQKFKASDSASECDYPTPSTIMALVGRSQQNSESMQGLLYQNIDTGSRDQLWLLALECVHVLGHN